MIDREVCGECDKYVQQEASCENQSKHRVCAKIIHLKIFTYMYSLCVCVCVHTWKNVYIRAKKNMLAYLSHNGFK